MNDGELLDAVSAPGPVDRLRDRLLPMLGRAIPGDRLGLSLPILNRWFYLADGGITSQGACIGPRRSGDSDTHWCAIERNFLLPPRPRGRTASDLDAHAFPTRPIKRDDLLASVGSVLEGER